MPAGTRSGSGGSGHGGQGAPAAAAAAPFVPDQVVPFLSSFAKSAFERFRVEHEAYVLRGGKIPMRQCIFSDLMPVLKIQLPANIDLATVDDATLLPALAALWAPRSRTETIDQLKDIRCARGSLKPGSGEIAQYCSSYLSFLDPLSAEVRPASKLVVRMFVKGLEPVELRDEVDTLSEGLTLEEVVKVTLDLLPECGKWLTVRAARKGDKPSGGGGNQSGRGAGRGSVQHSDTSGADSASRRGGGGANSHDGKPIVCHHCGEAGHIRPKCPKRDKPPVAPTSNKLRARLADSPPAAAPAAETPPVRPAPPDSASVSQGSGGFDGGSSGPAVSQTRRDDDVAQPPAPPGAGLRQRVRECPRLPVMVHHGGVVHQLDALLDTGSNVNMISRHSLAALGASVVPRPVSVPCQLSSGQVTATAEVDLEISIERGLPKPSRFPISLLVIDGATEDLIVGCTWLTDQGLMHLLEAATSDEVVDPAVEACRQGLGDEELPVPREETVHDDPDLQRQVAQLLDEFDDVFAPLSSTPAKLPPFDFVLSGEDKIKSSPPRRFSPRVAAEVEEEIASLIEQGVVEESSSHVAAGVVTIRKPDGSVRMCVDYRMLNSCTKPLQFPLPNSRDVLAKMAGKRYFARLDLAKGFYQVPLRPEDRKWTSFVTPSGQYQFTRLPFGLRNGPPYFQREMSRIFQPSQQPNLSLFIDDIGVGAASIEEYIATLRYIFQLARDHNLKFKRSKCAFNLASIEYVGFVAGPDGYTHTQARRQGLRDIAPPTNVSEVRSFVGLVNFFRDFIPAFAQRARPLTQLCGKGAQFVWGAEQQHAFDVIKVAVIECQVLAFIDPQLELVVQTDASTKGIGAVLLQRGGAHGEQPIAYLSRSFNSTEQRWSTIEQEAFALFFAIKNWSHYLDGRHFVVETDHRNLLWMSTSETPKVVRWHLQLMEYDFTVVHIPGVENVTADALSRLLGKSVPQSAAGYVPPGTMEATAAATLQQQLQSVHNATVGHLGVDRTLELLGQHFNVDVTPQLRRDVRQFVASCAICQKTRLRQPKVVQQVQTTAVFEPFQHLAVDTMGPLPEDAAGNKFIIVITDMFTRFVELVPCVDTTAVAAANALLAVVGRYGVPTSIRSDQGSQFTAVLVEELCGLLNVEQRFAIPYRPQANGLVERANQEIARHLRVLTIRRKEAGTWSRWLPLVQRTINATPNRVTGHPPARLLFGGAVDLSRQLFTPPPPSKGKQVLTDYVEQLIGTQRNLVRVALKMQQRHLEDYLKSSPPSPTQYAVGDRVLMSYPNRAPSKLHPRWRGPLAVVAVDRNTYTVRDVLTGADQEVNVDRLKPYVPDPVDDEDTVATLDEQLYLVESISAHRGSPKSKSAMTFMVRWKGFSAEDDTWEPYAFVKSTKAFSAYVN